jgi:hypothetical protein
MSDTQLRLQESPRLDQVCPRCHQPAGDADASCSVCLSPHHAECWDVGSACARCGGTSHFVALELCASLGGGPSSGRRPSPRRLVLQRRWLVVSTLVGVIAGLFWQVL